ncbi:MAG: hypothetical protein K0B10_13490 [Vicingaceae bacterium]|nr:hypothetical protein [Vicingaceae bacterium]
MKEHERQYETYFEFAYNNGQFFRLGIAKEMVESPNSNFNKEEDGLKELYLPPYKSDFEKLNIFENKLMLIQMKIDLAILYCSYMELLYDLLKGGCSGFGVSQRRIYSLDKNRFITSFY